MRRCLPGLLLTALSMALPGPCLAEGRLFELKEPPGTAAFADSYFNQPPRIYRFHSYDLPLHYPGARLRGAYLEPPPREEHLILRDGYQPKRNLAPDLYPYLLPLSPSPGKQHHRRR